MTRGIVSLAFGSGYKLPTRQNKNLETVNMNNKNEISNKTDSDSSDSTDSEDASESSSDSSSSSSHDDSSKKKKLPQAQQFSVMRSDTAGGLRMKISAVPVPVVPTQSNNNVDSIKPTNTSNKNHKLHKKQSIDHKQKRHENDTSSSWCSECSDSGSDSSSATNNQTTKRTNKTTNFKQTKPSNTRSTSSDSDTSEIDSDDKSKFLKFHSTSGNRSTTTDSSVKKPSNKAIGVIQTTDGADGASSSDMELPALVNAAIQRVESFSDGENSKNDPIPQYTSTLLRDFMVKTQMMGSSLTSTSSSIEKKDQRQLGSTGSNSRSQQMNKEIKTESPILTESAPQKRKRGRPKKQMPLVVNVVPITSESPDSGITSTPHSPVLPIQSTDSSLNRDETKISPNSKNQSSIKKSGTSSTASMPKLNIASLEKSIYATERVLYPPRRKKRDVSVNSTKTLLPEDLLDPVWRKIDINKKFRRPSVSGYKSDGGCSTVCSKVLAARCNNVSDYGSISQRSLSGYKSDYSCKSKRSGYKSDYSVKAKSCGYRTDSGMKNRKRVRKKRRLKSLCAKSPVNDLDILQLAGLSLGQSEESSRDSVNKSSGNLTTKSNFRRKSKNSLLDRDTNANTSKDILSSLCERVTKHLSGLDETQSSTSPTNSHKLVGGSVMKSSSSKSGMITCRRMSTISHCSSRSGASRMHLRRKHRKRLKSRCRSDNSDVNSSKLNIQIEMLTNFLTLCHINDKSTKADNTNKSKRVVKKRKQSVNSDVTNSSAATTSKRRHKKTPQTQSPDDHKLPLKKRLYLLTPGEKSDGKLNSGESESLPSTTSTHKTSTNAHAKIATKAITPKKRHLLENQHNATVSCLPKSLNSPRQLDSFTEPITIPVPTSVSTKSHQSRKKTKPECVSVTSKIQSSTRPSVIRSSSTSLPPPGVFESTIDLEVQIPTLPSIITKTEIDSPRTLGETITKIVKDEPNSKSERVVESLLNKTGGHLLLKKKRKKANRTGFPTIRKKKKKTLDDWNTMETKPSTISMEVDTESTLIQSGSNLSIDNCDRVPKSGETAATFIERNSRPRLSVVSLERLQGKVSTDEELGTVESPNGTLNVDKDEEPQHISEETTMVVKERRSDVIGRVKQHLKKNLREPRDVSSDNEPLSNLVASNTTSSDLSKVPLKESATKPSRLSTKVAEVSPLTKRSRRVISLDTLGEDQIKEIERTSKLAIVKLEMLKNDKVSGTRSRPSRHQLDNVEKTVEKPMIVEKTKRIKILTALETLGEPQIVKETTTMKMTRRLTRDMASKAAELTKRTRQNTVNLKVTETLLVKNDAKTTKTQSGKPVADKLVGNEVKNVTSSKVELSASKKTTDISIDKAETVKKNMKPKDKSFAPSTSDKSIAPSTLDKSIPPSIPPLTPDKSITPSTQEKSNTLSTQDKSNTPSTRDKSIIPSTRDKSITPSTRDKSITPSTRDKSITPSTRDKSIAPSTRDKSTAPSTRDKSIAPSTPDKSIAPSTPDKSIAPSTPDKSIAPITSDKSITPSQPTIKTTNKKATAKGREIAIKTNVTGEQEETKNKSIKAASNTDLEEYITPSQLTIKTTNKKATSKGREIAIKTNVAAEPEETKSKSIKAASNIDLEESITPSQLTIKTTNKKATAKGREIAIKTNVAAEPEETKNKSIKAASNIDLEESITPSQPTIKTTNKKATAKGREIAIKTNVAAEPEETKNKSIKATSNIDLEELLEKDATKIPTTNSGTPQCLITVSKEKKCSKSTSAKKCLKSVTRDSVDSKANYQSEFEKSISDTLPKKLVSKENVSQPLSQCAKLRTKSVESSAETKLVSTTKDRKRKPSIALNKHKDSDEQLTLEEAPKKRKTVESPTKSIQQPNVSNKTGKSANKKRNMKVTDKPLIELQPPIVDSTINQNKSIGKKTSEPLSSKKLRKDTALQQELSEPISKKLRKDTALQQELDSAASSITELADKTAHVRPFDPVNDLEHDPLPPEEGIQMVEPSSDSDSSKKAPKPKKKYLTAGLFSDYFKRSPKETEKTSTRTKDSVPDDHRVTLPIPLYCEKYFRRMVQDFELPYELWYAHQNEKLPGRNSVPSWNFKKLRTNIYGDVRANPSTDQQPCSCKAETACGDDCLNRLMYTECSPKTCPCAEKCQNTKIQRHIVAPGVERFMTQNKGWGVKTKQPLKKGTYILEYVGEVVTEREFKERMATLYVRDTHHYCLNLDGGLVIDGHRSGSDARFVNHSCSPNCEIQKWSVNGLFRMALFAMRDIEPGEELTYDYNFSLFNPAEGQPCRCDTPQCRGVIGGKSQRIKPIEPQVGPNIKSTNNNKGKTGRPRKNKANKNQSFMHHKDRSHIAFVHPTSKEMLHIKNGNCFLMRNIRKYRQKKIVPSSATPTTLTAQISALRIPRNIRTRGLTIAEHDPTIEKTARIAGILREICEELSNYKDKTGQCLLTKLNPPSKKKCPEYYEKIDKPVDLSTIELNVEKGRYKLPSSFDEDVMRLFNNVVKFYGLKSTEGAAAQELLSFYTSKKENVYQRLLTIIGDSQLIKTFVPDKPNQLLLNVDPNEDIIQCICGLFRDEGVMIQCSKCMVWQHTECTGADINADSYLCERCDSRIVDLEIPLNEYTDEGYRYYLTLMRGDLQVHQTDTVYVLRDIPITPDPDSTSPVRKHTYKTIGKIEYTECDIFRVERLWKDHEGNRFVFGHHYLRPHETYHEPTRKFYQNEVVRVPLYEVVPIDLVMGRCWVLDPTTFCKGRPVDCEEAHVYICELRMDKAARLFSKISKQQYPICTKTYAFNKFEQKLKISRNYLPHHIGNLATPKPKKKKTEEQTSVRKNSTPIVQLMPIPSKTLNEKRTRLESYLVALMTKVKSLNEDVQPINLSYLLTGRGARRRANVTTNVPL